jgi:hypothetical protein
LKLIKEGIKKMKKQRYLAALLRQKPNWILLSAKNPNHYMTKTHVLLHYIALRKMGEI